MADTLLIAGFEVEDEVVCIPDEWEEIDQPSKLVGHFLVSQLETGKAYLASNIMRLKSNKRVNPVDLISLSEDDSSSIPEAVKDAVNRLSPWGYNTEQGVFNIHYSSSSVKFYRLASLKKVEILTAPQPILPKVMDNNNVPCIPKLPSISKPAPKFANNELEVIQWDAKKGLYRCRGDRPFIVKQSDNEIMAVGILDGQYARALTPTEADEARELGLEIGKLG